MSKRLNDGVVLEIGDMVEVEDHITNTYDFGQVVFLERDDEFPVMYVYLKHEDEKLNDKTDERFGVYWKIDAVQI